MSENIDNKDNINSVDPSFGIIISVMEQRNARKIWLKFVGNGRNWGRHSEQEIQVTVNVFLGYYMDQYASGIGQSRQILRFFGPDGTRLEADKIAEDYELEDGDQIDVFEWQVGGKK